MGELRIIPLVRRHALIVEAADLVERKSAAAATRFWQMTMRRLRAELQIYGLNEQQQEAELRAFANAVLSRVGNTRHDHSGDAA